MSSRHYVYLPVEGTEVNKVGFTRKKVSELTPEELEYYQTTEGLQPRWNEADGKKWHTAVQKLFEARKNVSH